MLIRLGRAWRPVLCGLVLAALIALPTQAAGASPPRCQTANLRIDKTGENDATSHRGIEFALRNVGAATCTLKGYVTLHLLGSAAQGVATTEYHFGAPPAPHTVTLAPWHRAFFEMYFAVSGPCPAAVYAWGARFTPPGASAGTVWYAGRFDLCGPGPANVGISPLRSSPQF